MLNRLVIVLLKQRIACDSLIIVNVYFNFINQLSNIRFNVLTPTRQENATVQTSHCNLEVAA